LSVAYSALKRLSNRHPKALAAATFIIGLILGGLLRSKAAIFIILSLIGGFPLAILYGERIGLPSFVSCILVIVLDLTLAYIALAILSVLREYDRVKPYLEKLRRRYTFSAYRDPNSKLKRLGIAGIMIITTAFIGWWLSVIISYILNLELKEAMRPIAVGLSLGGVFAWAVYTGLAMAIPNPTLLAIAFLGILIGLTQILERMMGKKENKKQYITP